MERIVELRGLEGVYCSDVVHAYMSCNAEDVQKALAHYHSDHQRRISVTQSSTILSFIETKSLVICSRFIGFHRAQKL